MDVAATKLTLIQWLTELQDQSVLEKLVDFRQQNSDLSTEQQKVLDHRIKRYEASEMKFNSWDTVKERIRNRS